MVMCNAHMLINNVVHDRLFGTTFSTANGAWLKTVNDNLVHGDGDGPLFYFGTDANSPAPIVKNRALGADIWSLFLMSAIVPDRVASWFDLWRRNINEERGMAWVAVSEWEKKNEFSSDELATAWAFCLAKELGVPDLAERFRCRLAPQAIAGFERDPYLSGLFLLGEYLNGGAFRNLVLGDGA